MPLRPSRSAPALLLSGLLASAAPCDEPPAPAAGGFVAQHVRDGYTIEVTVDPAEPAAEGSYDIVLSVEGDPVLRFNGTRRGMPVKTWVSDLDQDERFEVIVLTADAAGEQRLYIQEWAEQSMALEALKPAPLDAETAALWRGGDQYDVEKDALYRSFPLHDPDSGERTGKTARLRYDFEAQRWEKPRRFLLF